MDEKIQQALDAGYSVEQIREWYQSKGMEIPDALQPKQEAKPVKQEQKPVTDIIQATREKAMAAFPSPDYSQIGRQLGLTARAGVTGAMALPNMAGDFLNSLINAIAGKPVLPMASQATSNLLTAAGVPQPETPTERVVQDVSQALAGVSAPATVARKLPSALSEFFLTSPVAQTAAAVGGASAGGLAREADLGPAAQLGLSLLGATAPAGATAATTVGRGAKEIVRPFTEEGRQVIVGNVLRQLAREPEQAIKQMEGYTPAIPGYTPTTAQASRDVGLISAETPIRSLATMGQFEAQASAANQARMKILDQMAKDRDALTAAIKKRDEVTAPLREQAFSKSTVDPETFNTNVYQTVLGKIDNILQSESGARKTVQNAMNFAKSTVENGLGSPSRLYEARKDLRDAAQGLLDKEGSAYSLAKKQLEEVIRAVDDAIESGAPGYKDYLQKYAQSSRGIERLEAAQEFRGKVLSTTPDPMRVGDYMISQPSFTRAIRAAEKETDLSNTQLAVLKRVATDLDSGVLNRAGRVPGSDTFKNLSTANVIGGIVGKQMFGDVPSGVNKMVAPLNWLFNGTDDQIRELLVNAMLDPKLAAAMMKKANVMTIEPLSKELKRRAIQAGYGASFGLTE